MKLDRVKFREGVFNPLTRSPQLEVNAGQNLSIEFDTETRILTLTALVRDPKKEPPKDGDDNRPLVPNPRSKPVMVFAENVAYAF